jgi:hypothetical protein
MNEKVSMEDDGKRISGRYVVKNGIVTVTASTGRATRGVIEDSMLSVATLARALLLQLHRHEAPTDDRGRCFKALNSQAPADVPKPPAGVT